MVPTTPPNISTKPVLWGWLNCLFANFLFTNPIDFCKMDLQVFACKSIFMLCEPNRERNASRQYGVRFSALLRIEARQ